VHNRDENSVRSNGGGNVRRAGPAVSVDADASDREVLLLDQSLTGRPYGIVLDHGCDDVAAASAGGECGAEDRQVVGLGGTRSEDDCLFVLRSDQVGDLTSGFAHRVRRGLSVDMRAGGVAVLPGEKWQHGFEDAIIQWRCGLVIEVDRQVTHAAFFHFDRRQEPSQRTCVRHQPDPSRRCARC
jgi:hypothetical protein